MEGKDGARKGKKEKGERKRKVVIVVTGGDRVGCTSFQGCCYLFFYVVLLCFFTTFTVVIVFLAVFLSFIFVIVCTTGLTGTERFANIALHRRDGLHR